MTTKTSNLIAFDLKWFFDILMMFAFMNEEGNGKGEDILIIKLNWLWKVQYIPTIGFFV